MAYPYFKQLTELAYCSDLGGMGEHRIELLTT